MTLTVTKPTLNSTRASHKDKTTSLTKAQLRALKRKQRKHRNS